MFHQTIVAGRLGADPELRYTANGKVVTNFSVAADYGFGDNKQTEWYRVTAWEKTAEACAQYLSKGDLVLVIGRMQTRSWEKDGEKRYATDLIANDVRFLHTQGANRNAGGDEPDIDDSDLPF